MTRLDGYNWWDYGWYSNNGVSAEWREIQVWHRINLWF